MDFMLENSGVVKVLSRDGPVHIDELVPAAYTAAMGQFVSYLEVLKALSCEPKTGVERFLAGLNPYETLDTMTPQDHENLLFIIDYFDLPAELATRVRFNLTRDIEKCFPDVLKIDNPFTDTTVEYYVCFWIAVDEIKGVNAKLSDKRIWNHIGIFDFCGQTANKKYFDYILSTFDTKEKIRWTNSLLMNRCRQIVEWMCESETLPGTKTFNEVIQGRIKDDDDVNNDDDRHSNNVACLAIMMAANKKWKQPFDCKPAFNFALANQNTEMLELLYSFERIDFTEDNYIKTADKKHTFVWLCNKKSPTMLSTINIQTLKKRVIKGFVCENVKWFHENIEPITDTDIVTHFPDVIEEYHEVAIWLQFINTDKMADTLKYYRSQGLNVMLPQFGIIAIIADDTKAIHLLHKWGFEFTMRHLDYAVMPQPDGYGHYSLDAFYLIHKYLLFCKLSKEIVNMFTWECSSYPVIYKNKIKYLKRCRRFRMWVKRLCRQA